MRKAFFILFFTIGICLGQLIPHTATLTSSKDSVRSDEVFTVTYTLTGVKGYVYIATEDIYFETIGKSRWEGEILEGEVKTLTFRMRLMENAMERLYNGIARIRIGFSFKPDNENINRAVERKSILIKIIDFADFINKQNEREKSLNKTDSTQSVNMIFKGNNSFLKTNMKLAPDATIKKLDKADKKIPAKKTTGKP